MNRLLIALAVTLTSLACSEIGPTNPFDPQAPKSVQALGTISGRVANVEDGNPVEEARVLLYHSDELPDGFCNLNADAPRMTDGGVPGSGERAVAEATTNEQGVFQLNELARGEYTLCVSHQRFLPLRRGELSVPIGGELALGEDLLVTPGKGTIIAQVDLGDLEIGSDQGQAVIQGVDVTLTPIGEGLGNSSDGTPNTSGAVTFSRIPLGSWRLRFAHPDYRPVVEDIELESIGQVIEVRGLLPIELEVNPGTVSGILVLEEPSPTSMEGIELTLTDNDDMATDASINLVTNPEMADYGRFTIDGDELRAGFYRLGISHNGSEYRPTTIAPVHVRAGQETDLGNVEIAYARGSVSGNVLTADNESSAGATVALSGLTEAITQTDATGAYRFDNVRGGAYSLNVSLSGYRTATVDDQTVSQDQETAVEDVILEINPGSLEGRVIDEEGDPISGVSAGIEGGVSAQTAEDGTFSLSGLRSGIYTVSVRKDGYVTETILNQAVNPGLGTDLGTVQMAHARNRLSGVVTTEDNASPSGAIIRLSGGPTTADAVAGSDGTFNFDNVRVGSYTVTVSLDGYRASTVAGIVVSDEQAGDAGTVDLQINPGSFSGTITDEAGTALQGATVAVLGGVNNITDENGAFTIEGLRAGDYSLTMSAAGHDPQTLRNQAVQAGANTELGVIALNFARNDLSGTVATEDGQSAAGAIVTVSEGPDEANAVVDADGGFHFDDLRVGTYTVTVTLEGYLTATAVSIEVAAEQAGDAGVVNLSINPGSFAGTITDEDGVALSGATISVSGGANTNTAEDGSFSVSGLRAGDYTLTLSANEHDSQVLRNQTITAGQDNNLGVIALNFSRNDLTGSVSSEDGASVTGALVTLSEGPTEANAVVDADGGFRFDEVRVGTYTVTVTLDGYQTATAAGIEVSAAQAGDAGVINLTVDPGSISGTLVDEAGLPISGATIANAGGGNTNSAEDGTFTVAGLRAGDYTLTISAQGFDLETLRNQSVQAGQDTDLGTIPLSYARNDLTGMVTTEDGVSPAGAIASLGSDGLTAGSAVVDADGSFAFEAVRAGEYTVTVTLDSYQSATAAGVTVSLDQAGDAGIIQLSINPGSVSGEIVDEEGNEVSGATVSITGGANTIADEEGAFNLGGLKAGEYTLTISADGFDSLVLRNILVEAGDNTNLDEVELSFARNDLIGSVTTEDNVSASGATVSLSGGPSSGNATVDANGNFSFEGIRVGTYTVTVSLTDYADGSEAGVTVTSEQAGDAGAIELQIEGGSLIGTVIDERGDALDLVTVTVVGGLNTTTDENGEFALEGLRAGAYALSISKDGYVTETLNNQAVSAGDETDVGNAILEYERGSLSGTVTLDGDGNPGSASILATANFDENLVADGLVRGNGTWEIEDLRVGQYTVEAGAQDYIAASDTAEVVADQDTQVNLNLGVDYGCRSGQIVLTDGGNDFASVELTIASTGAALNAANENGEFTIAALAPGEYTVRGSLAGYADGDVNIVVKAGEACDAKEFTLRLDDITAPDAPVLALLHPQWTALPDLDDGVTYIPEARYSDNNGTVEPDVDGDITGFTIVLNTEEINPLNDINFFNGADDVLVGFWRLTMIGVPPLELTADSFDLNDCIGAGGRERRFSESCIQHEFHPNHGYIFTFITAADGSGLEEFVGLNKVSSIVLQAVDTRENSSDPGQFQFMQDTDSPRPSGNLNPMRLTVDGAQCVSPANLDFELCYTNDESVTIKVEATSISDSPGAFGCTYLYSNAIADGVDTDVFSQDWADNCLYWDEDAAPNCEPVPGGSLLDTAECHGPGTPRISVTPDAPQTLYCVRAFDRAGQMSNSGCVVVVQDSDNPVSFDAYPTNVSVRGPAATIYLTSDQDGGNEGFPDNLDDNFNRFEIRSDAPGAQFVPALCVGGDCTRIEVALEAGRSNTFEIVAVDDADNRSEAIEVVLHEESNVGIAEFDGAVGNSPALFGSNIVWAEPRSCNPVGDDGELHGRGCSHHIQFLDKSLPINEVRTLSAVPQLIADEFSTSSGDYRSDERGGLTTCLVACGDLPSTLPGGNESPMMRLASTGLYVASYHEGKDLAVPYAPTAHAHRLFYQGFGGDGVPSVVDDCYIEIIDNQADDQIVALETNEEVLAYVRYRPTSHCQNDDQCTDGRTCSDDGTCADASGYDGGYRLFMRPQFGNDLGENGESACELGLETSWTQDELSAEPITIGVINDAIYAITTDDRIHVYTKQGNNRKFSMRLTLSDAGFVNHLSELPEGTVPRFVTGAFAENSLRLIVRWSTGDGGEQIDVQRLYSFNMDSGKPCNQCSGEDATEECFRDCGGIHQRVHGAISLVARDGACNCPDGWGCFEGNTISPTPPEEKPALCIHGAWAEGLGPPSENCTNDSDCGDDQVCYGLPTNRTGSSWNSWCVDPCDAFGECADGYTCERDTASTLTNVGVELRENDTYHVCSQATENIDFTAASCDWCGEVNDVSIDGNIMAWTSHTEADGTNRYALNAARLPDDFRQMIIPRNLVVPRASKITEIDTVGDDVVYLDASSGTNRVRQARVTTQNWTAIGPSDLHPKREPRAGSLRILYASYSPDNESLDSDGLYITTTERDFASAPIDLAPNLFANCSLTGASVQHEWKTGHGYDVDGNTAAIYARTDCGRFAFVSDIGITAPELSWNSVLIPLGGPDNWTDAEPVNDQRELSMAVTDQGHLIYNRPSAVTVDLNALGNNACLGQGGSFGVKLRPPTGNNTYPMQASESLNMMPLDANSGVESFPNVAIVPTDCTALDAAYNSETRETHVVCAGFPSGCDNNSSRQSDKGQQSVIYYRYDQVTDDLGEQIRLLERVDLVSVVNPVKEVAAESDDLDRYYDSDCDEGNPDDYTGLDFNRCGLMKLTRTGIITGAVINRNGVIALELEDDAIRNIAIIDPGSDERWGHSGAGAFTNDDRIELVYTRLGDNLGGLSINQSALVFADSRKTFQTEILRVSLNDHAVQRVTTNDRTQSYPALTTNGIIYVDDRYSLTASGRDLTAAAITRQQVNTNCDNQYNRCPGGFSCVGDEDNSQCFPTAKVACDPENERADFTSCGSSGTCVEYPQDQCIGLNVSCSVCLDPSAANDRCANVDVVPENETGCHDFTGCRAGEVCNHETGNPILEVLGCGYCDDAQ